MKPIAVLVITYNRKSIVLETVRRLKQFLVYSGEIRYFVADDGSDDGTQEALRAAFPDVAIVQNQRIGLGASENAGIRAALYEHEFMLQLQDDLHLQMPLDLHPHVALLERDTTAGFVRLWGVCGHRYVGTLDEQYWRIHWDSPELYIPSDRPHLKHRRFHDRYGMYPEGLKTAETEHVFCLNCKAAVTAGGAVVDVMVPQNAPTEISWEHVGWHDRWRDKGL